MGGYARRSASFDNKEDSIMARYAYIRLDEDDKDSTRQALLLDDISGFDRIFVDNFHLKEYKKNASGQNVSDNKLIRLIENLQPGDTVYAASADRVCDSIREFINLVKDIRDKGADFICLDISFDTRSDSSEVAMRIMEKLDEIERTKDSNKKIKGIEKARNKGRRIGRPPVSIPSGFRDVCKAWESGEITGPEAIERSGLKSTSFYKKAGELGFKKTKNKT